MRSTLVAALLSIALPYLPGVAQDGPEGGAAVSAAALPEACVLESVPYIGPDWQTHLDGPQDFLFPSALGSLMKFAGEPEPYRYRLFMATSGFAFRVLWHPTRPDSGFDSVWLLAEDPLEPIRRTMDAAGYEYELIGNADVQDGERRFPREGLPERLPAGELRRRVGEELLAGRPLIAINVRSGAGIIAGYEDAGRTLLGWTMPDPEAETHPLGYVKLPDWTDQTEAVLFLREKREPPPLEDTLRQALTWAVQTFRTPRIGEYASGWAAFDAWAQALLDDARWSADDLPALKAAADAHFFATLTVAEGRAFGAEAPERLATLRPEVADDLHVAEGSYWLMHDLVWRLWQTVEGTTGPADPPLRFTDPGVRAELVRLVSLERDLDAGAIAHLERALRGLGVAGAEIPPASPAESEAVARNSALLNVSGADRSRFHVAPPEQGSWLSGALPVGWGQGKDCTFVGALESALAPTACPYSYDDLMGYSGLAFRTRWFHNPAHAPTSWGADRWHPISPHGEGPEEVAALSRATGWQLRREELPQDRNDPRYQHLITDLVLSVNRGLPAVIGLNTDLATVYGYHIWSMNLILRDYQRSDQDDVRTQANDPGFHSPVIFLEGHVDPPEPHEALLESLRLAIRNMEREPADGFLYGPPALRTWADDLLAYEAHTDEERRLLCPANWWTLMHLLDARESAVRYLQGNADLLTGDAQTALFRALDAYREETLLLHDFVEANLGFLPWYGGTQQPADWDATTRQAQAELLNQAAELEDTALAALKEAAPPEENGTQ